MTYDDASNVTSVTDKTSGELASYQYDALDRLTDMTLNGVSGASYSYDAAGDLLTKQEGLNGANALTLSYPGTLKNPGGGPHVIRSSTRR